MKNIPQRILMSELIVGLGLTFLLTSTATAQLVRGGGNKKTDCMSVFQAPGANHPAPPKDAKNIDCVDGDVSCDADGTRNARCQFDLQVCLNSTMLPFPDCVPGEVDFFDVDNAVDDGNRKFDPAWQTLQLQVAVLGLPSVTLDECTTGTVVDVPLRPGKNNKFKKDKKKLKIEANGTVGVALAHDKDKMKFTCRPEGDGIYTPMDLYDSTFDRIAQQMFVPGCALSGCHDDQTAQAGLNLLPADAYAEIAGVVPTNVAAAGDGLLRITANDVDQSYVYQKMVMTSLELAGFGYGQQMPLLPGIPPSQEIIDIMELWILDGAPETGWTPGTDQ